MATRVISVVSGKGGVGKTTVVANLGSALAQKFKKRVTVIDCNITTSHLGLSLGLYYWPASLNKVLRGESSVEESLLEHSSGMKVLPASVKHKDVGGADLVHLRHLIKELARESDMIILDASPGLGREAMFALNACDEVLLVANPNVPSAIDLIRCKEALKDLSKKIVGIVLNKVSGKKHELTKQNFEWLTELPVIAEIPFDDKVSISLARETPVVMLYPHSPAAQGLSHLSAKLVGEKFVPANFLQRLLDSLGIG